jgi:hypothetical protein
MKTKDILAQWVAMETGDGLQRVQRVSRTLSVASFILCVSLTSLAAWFWLPGVGFVLGGAVVGWLIGERNRLDTRKHVWPTVREYLDWPRIHDDLAASKNGSVTNT